MHIAFVIFTGFICLWAWSESLKQINLLALGKHTSTIRNFLPLIFAYVFLSVDWMLFAALAWLVFILIRWLPTKTEILNFAKCFFFLTVFAIGFQFLLQRLSGITQVSEPDMWIFLLGDTSWKGLFVGFAAGFTLKTILREQGHAWWFAPVLILSGIASLGFAWGLFLGDRWNPRNLTSTIFSLVGFVLGLFLTTSYNPSFKWEYWFATCLVWICVETLIFRRQARI